MTLWSYSHIVLSKKTKDLNQSPITVLLVTRAIGPRSIKVLMIDTFSKSKMRIRDVRIVVVIQGAAHDMLIRKALYGVRLDVRSNVASRSYFDVPGATIIRWLFRRQMNVGKLYNYLQVLVCKHPLELGGFFLACLSFAMHEGVGVGK